MLCEKKGDVYYDLKRRANPEHMQWKEAQFLGTA
jgi:hypothetical protein